VGSPGGFHRGLNVLRLAEGNQRRVFPSCGIRRRDYCQELTDGDDRADWRDDLPQDAAHWRADEVGRFRGVDFDRRLLLGDLIPTAFSHSTIVPSLISIPHCGSRSSTLMDLDGVGDYRRPIY
jgi:hypothetical protein